MLGEEVSKTNNGIQIKLDFVHHMTLCLYE